MSDRETTKDLLERLRRHYIKPGPMPGGVFVPECGINGGAQTRADALYVGFTSTSGRLLVGHEIKVSRADWRKELDSAGKADFWADNCHQWYIVAPSTDIVPPEELPHGWGLMVPNPRTTTRMDIKVKAVTDTTRTPSWNATRSILARLDTLRAQHDVDVQQKATDKARADMEERYAARTEQSLTAAQRGRLDALTRLEEALGVQVDKHAWHDEAEKIRPDLLAAAIQLVRLSDKFTNNDRYAAATLRRSIESVTEGLAEYEEIRRTFAEIVGKP